MPSIINNPVTGKISWAGIPLIVPPRELIDWVAKLIDPSSIYEFADNLNWPGKNLTALTFKNVMPRRPINVGHLLWPIGASNWAIGHFICSKEQLIEFRPNSWDKDELQNWHPVLQQLQLASDYGNGKFIVANMYLLPPRPLVQWAFQSPSNGAYLLTFVDQRFFWWFKAVKDLVVNDTTQWIDIFDAIGVALDLVISVDDINASYLTPGSDFTAGQSSPFDSEYEALPLLFDAAAYNVGHRVIAGMDGSVKTLAVDTAIAQRNANIVNADAVGVTISGGGVVGLGKPSI